MVANIRNVSKFGNSCFRAIQNSMVVKFRSNLLKFERDFRTIQNSMVANKYYPPNRYRLGWFFV